MGGTANSGVGVGALFPWGGSVREVAPEDVGTSDEAVDMAVKSDVENAGEGVVGEGVAGLWSASISNAKKSCVSSKGSVSDSEVVTHVFCVVPVMITRLGKSTSLGPGIDDTAYKSS